MSGSGRQLPARDASKEADNVACMAPSRMVLRM